MYYSSKKCRICNSRNIKVGLNLGKVIIGEKYSNKKFGGIKKYPLSISFCKDCKNVQTNEIVNLHVLWQEYTYLTGQTKAIVKHFEEVARNISKIKKLNFNDLVVDIGSNDGTFLKFFKKRNIKVLGVDGAKNVAKIANDNKIKTIDKFFDFKLSKKIKKHYKNIKIITCFNAFAHSPDLNTIIKGIKEILDDDGIFVFECQYLLDIYRNNIVGTFFHEHLYHHSLESLENLFNLHSLNFFYVYKAKIQKGSIIGYVAKKSENLNKTIHYKKLMKVEKEKNLSIKSLKMLKKYINIQKSKYINIISKFKINEIGIYGSARSGPIYFENLNMSNRIKYIFDDHELKINKFSPLINKKILPTKDIYVLKLKALIILAYLHSKKIIEKNLKFLQDGGIFITVYPEVRIINKTNYKKFI